MLNFSLICLSDRDIVASVMDIIMNQDSGRKEHTKVMHLPLFFSFFYHTEILQPEQNFFSGLW